MANVTWAPHTANVTFSPAHRANVTWWVHNGVTTWQAPVATSPTSEETGTQVDTDAG